MNCFLVLANEHLSTSRKDCDRFKALIHKDPAFFSKRSLILSNASSSAAKEAWPGQLAKEREKANEVKDGVTALREEIKDKSVEEVKVSELSNQIISEIFNHIITVCKAAATAPAKAK